MTRPFADLRKLQTLVLQAPLQGARVQAHRGSALCQRLCQQGWLSTKRRFEFVGQPLLAPQFAYALLHPHTCLFVHQRESAG